MIKCVVKGNSRKFKRFLSKCQSVDFDSLLTQYAEEGVEALKSATPAITGKTANSWSYSIEKSRKRIGIYWTNSNMNDGVPIAVILEYGHGTGWGGYVQGRHYISPAIQPVFDKITENAWKEVTSIHA